MRCRARRRCRGHGRFPYSEALPDVLNRRSGEPAPPSPSPKSCSAATSGRSTTSSRTCGPSLAMTTPGPASRCCHHRNRLKDRNRQQSGKTLTLYKHPKSVVLAIGPTGWYLLAPGLCVENLAEHPGPRCPGLGRALLDPPPDTTALPPPGPPAQPLSCADPMCSTSRDPRREECTIVPFEFALELRGANR